MPYNLISMKKSCHEVDASLILAVLLYIAGWCNGNTSGSESETGGSNPSPATMKGALFMKNFMMRGVVLAALLSSLVLPASAAWSNTDSNNLASIKTYTGNIYTVLNQSSLGSRLSSIVTNTQNAANYLSTISTRIGTSSTWPTINGQLTKIIGQNTDSYTRLGTIKDDILSIKTSVSNIYTKMGTGGGSADLTKVNNNTDTLVTKSSAMVSSLGQIEIKTNAAQTFLGYINTKIDDVKSSVVSMSNQFTLDRSGGEATMRHYLKNLSDVLANDDDVALRESQKENTNQVKQDFVSGSSSGTSLGKSDFGSLSSVGSTAKDIASLNGQASVGSFTDGLTAADTQGQGWFSETTRAALDAVTSPVATNSLDDHDTYNMGNFAENYYWVFGGAGR